MTLTLRARLTWCAHLFKACAKQYHQELTPLLTGLIPPDGIVLDVGSHAGQFAKLFARIARHGHVHAFEPGRYALSILRRTLAFHRLANVTIHARGCSDTPGRLALSVPVKASGSIGFGLGHIASSQPEAAGRRTLEESIELTTVDHFAHGQRLARLDFIKADIEGWELRMLVGAADTLRRFHPTLLLEVHAGHLARAGDTPQALFTFLADLGYRAFRLDRAALCLQPAAAAIEGDMIFLGPDTARRVVADGRLLCGATATSHD
ncbi:MAG: FkbM family methyltransferase [Alphaproteobacteria bacterium]